MDELILEKLLEGPFSHFKQVGQDDWRDPHRKNSSLSLSNRGYYDHRTGCCGSLLELGKSYHLSGLEKFSDSSRVPLTQKIWEKSHLAKNADTPAFQLIKSYFTGHRSIPLHGYEDLLKVGLIRLNEYQGERMIVYPSLAPQDAQDAICSRYYEVNRIQRIFLNGDGSQKEKKHLGSTGNAAAGFLIPPLNDDQGEKVVLVVEGLEDALSIRIQKPSLWILVGNDKAGLRKLDGFFTEQFKNCMIIADHDTDKDHAIT